MGEGERLQRAVSFTMAAGYQLNKEAFEFLTAISQRKDPINLMEEAIRKITDLSEKPLFIDRNFLEEMVKESFPDEKEPSDPASPSRARARARKKVFHAYAKGVVADIKVVDDPTERICTTGSVEEYLEYFQDRFRRIEKILRQRMDARNAMSISDVLKSPARTRVKIIGMITEKRESNERIFLTLEDLKARVTVLVPRNARGEIQAKAQSLLLDQVICVGATKGKNDILVAEDFIWPDVPRKKPHKAPIPVYAALISDLHVGSRMFMGKAFGRFVSWLRGKLGDENMRNTAGHVKYLVIAGDLVDGIGIYPGQKEELLITDIYEQYQEMARLVEGLPDYIELIIIPGNHDAVRKALPQPAISKKYAKALYETRSIRSFGNPCTISLHDVELLLYHGRSLDDVAAVAPNVSFKTPDKTMRILLQSRHLAPIYGGRTPIAPANRDFTVIETVPDIFHAGHVHVVGHSIHRGTLVVNSGAWQGQTGFQKKMGVYPTPGIVPIVNLQTLQISTIDFTSAAA